MRIDILLEFLEGIGLAIAIGVGALLAPFGLLFISRILPWFIWRNSNNKRGSSVASNNSFSNVSEDKNNYIRNCHPSQVFKRLKSDGLQSLFINYDFPQTPVYKPDKFYNKNAPKNLLNSSNPIPVDKELNRSSDNATHRNNLAPPSKNVNQIGTLPVRESFRYSLIILYYPPAPFRTHH